MILPERRGTSAQFCAGRRHFSERAIRITGMGIDSCDRVRQDDDVQPGLQRVQHRLFDTVFGREPGDVHGLDLPAA